MHEFLARQHWNFSTAPVLRGPDHRSMGGLALAFSSTHSCIAFSLIMIHGDFGIAPEKAIFAIAEDLRRHLRCALPTPDY